MNKPTRKYFFVFLFIIFAITEISLRFYWGVYERKNNDISVIHPVSCIKHDSVVGYTISGGEYTYELCNSYKFSASHNSENERKCSVNSSANNKSLVVFGDSFSYGFGVSDGQTFSCRLAERLDSTNVYNKSVPGYSALINYLNLKRMLYEGDRPDMVIFLYTDYDKYRLIYNPFLVKGFENEATNPDVFYPVAELDQYKSLVIKKTSINPKEFDMRRYSATVNLADDLWRYFYFKNNSENLDELEYLIHSKIIEECKKHKVKLLYVNVKHEWGDGDKLKFGQQQNVWTCSVTIPNKPEFSLEPNDSHPSSLAHELVCDSIYTFIRLNNLGL